MFDGIFFIIIMKKGKHIIKKAKQKYMSPYYFLFCIQYEFM